MIQPSAAVIMQRVGILFAALLAGSLALGVYADESLDASLGRSLLTQRTQAVPVFKFIKGGNAVGGQGGAGGDGGFAIQAGVVQIPIGLLGSATAANSNSADGGSGGNGGNAVGGAGRKLLTRDVHTVTIPIFEFKGGKAVGGKGGAGGNGGTAVQVGVIQVPVSVLGGDSTAINNNSADGGSGGNGGNAVGGNGRKLLTVNTQYFAVPIITFKGGKAVGGKGGAGGNGGAAGQIGIIQVPVALGGDAIASNNNSADGGNGGNGGNAVGGAGRKMLTARTVTIPVFKFKGGKAVGGKGGAGGDGGVAVQAGVIQVPISLLGDATAVNNNSADGGNGGNGGNAAGGLGRKLLTHKRTVAVPVFKFVKGGNAVGGAGGAGGNGGFALQTGVIQVPISVFGDATAVNNNSADGGNGGNGGNAVGGNGWLIGK